MGTKGINASLKKSTPTEIECDFFLFFFKFYLVSL
jgi:hypothetical protein